jgi:hypothetical protein
MVRIQLEGSASRIARRATGGLLACALLCGLATAPAGAAPFISIVTDAITLIPTPTDYVNDYVEATGAAGIGVKVKNTSSSGLHLLVRSASASPPIALGDLLVRTLTAPGAGGVTSSAYTPLSATTLALWSSGVPQGPFVQVNVDLRIRNLWSYDDTGTVGTTLYTNTLIFTVVEP